MVPNNKKSRKGSIEECTLSRKFKCAELYRRSTDIVGLKIVQFDFSNTYTDDSPPPPTTTTTTTSTAPTTPARIKKLPRLLKQAHSGEHL